MADLSSREKTYRDFLQKFLEAWLQLVSGLSQKGHREFKATQAQAIYMVMLKKLDIW